MKSPEALTVTVRPGLTTTALVYPPDHDPLGPGGRAGLVGAVLILGHGAGAGQLSPWIVNRARALSDVGLEIITFNFLYTEQRRRMPDRRPLLDACYRAVIGAVKDRADGERALFIGGKSMGGRIATHVAADDRDLDVKGLVLLGYPLHPPGKPQERRDAHLPAVGRPMLFVQGSRDAFGTTDDLQPVLATLSPRPSVHVVEGGDHSFKVARATPQRQADVFADLDRAIVEFTRTLSFLGVPDAPGG